MFDALVVAKENVMAPLLSGMAFKKGVYLATLGERTKEILEREGRLRTNSTVRVENPVLHRIANINGRTNTIDIRENEISNYNEGILENSQIPVFGYGVETLLRGQDVVVSDDNLLSYGTRGKVRGFAKGANGNILAYIDYMEDAAPLRISADKIEPWKPKGFWMVQPSHIDNNGQTLREFSNNHQNANASINYIFTSRRQAQNYALSMTRSHNRPYVVMGASDYVNRDGQMLSYE